MKDVLASQANKSDNDCARKSPRRIFIIGNPRSGTTLLRLIITSHSDVVVPPECGFIVWLYDKYRSWSSINSSCSDFRQEFLNDLFKTKKFDTWNLSYTSLEEKIALENPSNYARLCDVVYSVYGDAVGQSCAILGDKNNFYINHLGILKKIFPDAFFLHIVRDGRDIACSYREVMKKTYQSPYAPKLETDIDLIAKEWLNNLRQVASFFDVISSSRKTSVRYEDLVTHPDSVLQKICSWLGIEFESEMLSFYKKNKAMGLEPKLTVDWKKRTLNPVSKDTVGRYLDMLSLDEIKTFNSIGLDALLEFGYLNSVMAEEIK